MVALYEEITTDIYVRKIDISHNKIPEEPIINGLIESMRYNESLVNIGLEGNPGLTENVRHKLALSLLKNMDIMKTNATPIRASWLNLK